MNSYAKWSSILLVTLVGAGCGVDASGTVEVGAATEPIMAGSPAIADAVTANLTHLELTVKEIDVHVATGDDVSDHQDSEASAAENEASAAEDDGVWVPIRGDHHIDLFFGTHEIALGAAAIPPGRITQIRLVLDGDVIFSNGAERVVVPCPSCTTSGLKILVDDDLVVEAGGIVSIRLTFDLAMAALEHDKGLKLGPVVHVEGEIED